MQPSRAKLPRAVGTLLDVIDLQTQFVTRGGVVRAVDGVSWDVAEGETVALVGESGCGKSVSALSIMRLVAAPAGRVVGGRILFKGRDLLPLDEESMRRVRGSEIAMIFQEAMTSLNPVLTIGRQITEGLETHHGMAPTAAPRRSAGVRSIRRRPDPARRARHRARDLRHPPASLHAGAAAAGPAAGRAAPRAPRSHRGPAAGPHAFAGGLRVRAALRVPCRALRRRDAAAAADRRARSRHRLLGGGTADRGPRARRRPPVSTPRGGTGEALLEVRNLVKHFEIGGGLFGGRRRLLRAAGGVSFSVRPREDPGLLRQFW